MHKSPKFGNVVHGNNLLAVSLRRCDKFATALAKRLSQYCKLIMMLTMVKYCYWTTPHWRASFTAVARTYIRVHWVNGNSQGGVVPVEFLLVVCQFAGACPATGATTLRIAYTHHSEYYQRHDETHTDEHHYCHTHSCTIATIRLQFLADHTNDNDVLSVCPSSACRP